MTLLFHVTSLSCAIQIVSNREFWAVGKNPNVVPGLNCWIDVNKINRQSSTFKGAMLVLHWNGEVTADADRSREPNLLIDNADGSVLITKGTSRGLQAIGIDLDGDDWSAFHTLAPWYIPLRTRYVEDKYLRILSKRPSIKVI